MTAAEPPQLRHVHAASDVRRRRRGGRVRRSDLHSGDVREPRRQLAARSPTGAAADGGLRYVHRARDVRGRRYGEPVRIAELHPMTCTQAGANCGPVADGCGGIIQCGTCTAPDTCGGGGVTSVCGTGGVK